MRRAQPFNLTGDDDLDSIAIEASSPMTCSAARGLHLAPLADHLTRTHSTCATPRERYHAARRREVRGNHLTLTCEKPRAVSWRQVFAENLNFNASSRTPELTRRETPASCDRFSTKDKLMPVGLNELLCSRIIETSRVHSAFEPPLESTPLP